MPAPNNRFDPQWVELMPEAGRAWLQHVVLGLVLLHQNQYNYWIEVSSALQHLNNSDLTTKKPASESKIASAVSKPSPEPKIAVTSQKPSTESKVAAELTSVDVDEKSSKKDGGGFLVKLFNRKGRDRDEVPEHLLQPDEADQLNNMTMDRPGFHKTRVRHPRKSLTSPLFTSPPKPAPASSPSPTLVVNKSSDMDDISDDGSFDGLDKDMMPATSKTTNDEPIEPMVDDPVPLSAPIPPSSSQQESMSFSRSSPESNGSVKKPEPERVVTLETTTTKLVKNSSEKSTAKPRPPPQSMGDGSNQVADQKGDQRQQTQESIEIVAKSVKDDAAPRKPRPPSGPPPQPASDAAAGASTPQPDAANQKARQPESVKDGADPVKKPRPPPGPPPANAMAPIKATENEPEKGAAAGKPLPPTSASTRPAQVEPEKMKPATSSKSKVKDDQDEERYRGGSRPPMPIMTKPPSRPKAVESESAQTDSTPSSATSPKPMRIGMVLPPKTDLSNRSFSAVCSECDCKEFALNPFKPGSCNNCFHKH